MMFEETTPDQTEEIKVSFGYHCNGLTSDSSHIQNESRRNLGSFHCLSGAALSANATLANTSICNGFIGAEILPNWDSPKSFRRIPSSPSFSKLDLLSSSLQSNISILSCSPSSASEPSDHDSFLKSTSCVEVEVAGGAAGEDRVQAVCSEENGWLFCAIYDGFNGRDAADFLAGTFYETLSFNLSFLDWELKQDSESLSDNNNKKKKKSLFMDRVLDSLQRALGQAENDFLYMVKQEMEDRPDLVSIGSCVLVALLHGKDLYILNLGDSRAVLATYTDETTLGGENRKLNAIQLTDSHTVDNEAERNRLLRDHPDDPETIVGGKVKGKLKVTRAFGVGYLKKRKMNNALIGILKVQNLVNPPYVSTDPSVNVHNISDSDHFVILGSDGLFDFFSNDEVVKLVDSYMLGNPFGDPATFLLEELVARAADSAGFSMEELMSIPPGRRRKYHDDVTVIVVILGPHKRTTKASTRL
ncbi:probable protein phosphatase 2C 40 [Impatiens glandulifera]|uniref:probable protein phosphatase 2C 40 n=1 Tax=Impatiens glandulifera TaxID=253017 RepID=UPI001FB0504A|nr:probable protein phosphatase 2C 40 [Impatiens glandulifera]